MFVNAEAFSTLLHKFSFTDIVNTSWLGMSYDFMRLLKIVGVTLLFRNHAMPGNKRRMVLPSIKNTALNNKRLETRWQCEVIR